jgi:hypothetical protein
MILVALALLGFGVVDLVRWSPDDTEWPRAVVAAIAGTVTVGAAAALSGMDWSGVLLAVAISFVVLLLWSAYELLPSRDLKPEFTLALVMVVIVALIALSGSADPIGGDLAKWYSKLGFGFVHQVLVDQFVLGVGATLFLLGTANRIVQLVLRAARPSLLEGEDTLHGGRLLGPMERLIVAAAVLSGSGAAAGFVIAAKGLLRFREIGGAPGSNVDEITEYFLIGTFTSTVLAGAVAILILAVA